ncbi:MAG: tetratricopeptide repeat-containing sensor histidine kinase [Flammeovirgaceae bacterium]
MLLFIGTYLSPSYAAAHQLVDSLYYHFLQEPEDEQRIHRMLNKVEELWQSRKYRDAFELAVHAKQFAEELHYDNGLNYADLHIGILHFWLGNYKESMRLSLKVLSFFEEQNDYLGIAEVYNLLAKVYAVQDGLELAINYQREALEIFEEYNDTLKISNCLNNIGVYHFELGHYEEAMRYYKRAQEIHTAVNDLHGLCITLSNFGEVYNRQKLPQRALPYFEEALALAKAIDDYLILAHANNEKGKAYTQLEEFDLAEEYLSLGRKYALKAEIKREQLINYQYSAELFTKKKAFEKAMFWQTHYLQLKDSTYNETKSQQMINLNIAYETEKKNQQILGLKMENELQEKMNQYNRLLLVVFVVAFLIALGGGIFWRKISNERKLNNLQLLQQQQAIQQKNEQIQQQSDRLQELNEVKTRLFSIISHDIRSPLSQLQGVLALLDAAQLTEEESKVVFKTINENVGYVNGLTENLLFWAKCQMGGIQAKPLSFDVAECIEETRQLLNLQAQRKKILLENKFMGSAIVWADKDMISLVLRNLLSNAIKFTPNQGGVCIDLREDIHQITICIEDTGVGIDPERLPHLFSQVTESTIGTANEKGTGLGLQVCREFVMANCGEIWVESTLGAGSIFCFNLPKSQN